MVRSGETGWRVGGRGIILTMAQGPRFKTIRASEPRSDKATLVVFSDDLDKALAVLVIATAAVFLEINISMFSTFRGINILKERRVFEGKDLTHRLLECSLRPV